MTVKFANGAVSRLANSISSTATSVLVLPGDGAKFPVLGAGDSFPVTLIKVDGTYEICRCTARSSDELTIARGQEITEAVEFSAGDRIELRMTAGSLDERLAEQIKTSGLQAGKLKLIAASTILTEDDVGAILVPRNAADAVLTLPLAGSVSSGSLIQFSNHDAGVWTINKSGTDTIAAGDNISRTSIELKFGDSLTLASDGSHAWYAVDGSAQFLYAQAFSAAVSAAGYHKLPSGLIIQWGSVWLNSSITATDVTFPIAFPTAVFMVAGSQNNYWFSESDAQSQQTYFSTVPLSLSQFRAYQRNGTTGQKLGWIAVGH